jgi:hypothetical protein
MNSTGLPRLKLVLFMPVLFSSRIIFFGIYLFLPESLSAIERDMKQPGLFFLSFCLTLCLIWQCNPSSNEMSQMPQGKYLNHHDSVGYVGMKECIECHYEIYQSYMQTGMGRSFGMAHPGRRKRHCARRNLYHHQSDFG